MKTFTNANPKDIREAITLLSRGNASIVGGGSDLLGMVKERLMSPDVLVNLKSIRGLDKVETQSGKMKIGGLITLDALSHDAQIRKNYAVPSYIVHPSDTAPALVALDAEFHVSGPSGDRVIPAGQFFQLPRVDAARENVLAPDDVLVAITLPAARPGVRSTYHKVLDREAWTHAVVSVAMVLEMDKQICRSARIVLGGVAPIPWRLPRVEAMLAGQRITPELAAKAGEAAIVGARPLAKNKYKVPLTQNVVKRTLLSLA
jgi:CO/xanthine dehydrogenase FAD-binding subunit